MGGRAEGVVDFECFVFFTASSPLFCWGKVAVSCKTRVRACSDVVVAASFRLPLSSCHSYQKFFIRLKKVMVFLLKIKHFKLMKYGYHFFLDYIKRQAWIERQTSLNRSLLGFVLTKKP